jgi:secondary thiamine-phosphate synthase enzyme
MTVATASIQLTTKGHTDIHDITDRVNDIIGASGLKNGIVTIFCPSSTSALTTIEFEPGVLNDLRRLFDEVADPNRPYQHDQAWGDGNGHAHVRAALLGPSLTVPFAQGQLTLGTWQQIVHLDFDNRSRRRELVVQIMGE